MIKNFKLFLESFEKTLDLYHGTCAGNAINLTHEGYKPGMYPSGGNEGNPKYLYLSSGKEDALWFAEEKGCNSVLLVKNIPISFLEPDPEDEAGFTMKELLDSLEYDPKYPRKFVLTRELSMEHFSVI